MISQKLLNVFHGVETRELQVNTLRDQEVVVMKEFFKFDKVTRWLYPISFILIYCRLYVTEVSMTTETSFNELRFFLFGSYYSVVEPILILIALRLILMIMTGQNQNME